MTITRVGIVGSCPLAEAFVRALERAGVVAVVGDKRSGNADSAAGAVPGEAAHDRATLQEAAEEDTVFLAVSGMSSATHCPGLPTGRAVS